MDIARRVSSFKVSSTSKGSRYVLSKGSNGSNSSQQSMPKTKRGILSQFLQGFHFRNLTILRSDRVCPSPSSSCFQENIRTDEQICTSGARTEDGELNRSKFLVTTAKQGDSLKSLNSASLSATKTEPGRESSILTQNGTQESLGMVQPREVNSGGIVKPVIKQGNEMELRLSHSSFKTRRRSSTSSGNQITCPAKPRHILSSDRQEIRSPNDSFKRPRNHENSQDISIDQQQSFSEVPKPLLRPTQKRKESIPNLQNYAMRGSFRRSKHPSFGDSAEMPAFGRTRSKRHSLNLVSDADVVEMFDNSSATNVQKKLDKSSILPKQASELKLSPKWQLVATPTGRTNQPQMITRSKSTTCLQNPNYRSAKSQSSNAMSLKSGRMSSQLATIRVADRITMIGVFSSFSALVYWITFDIHNATSNTRTVFYCICLATQLQVSGYYINLIRRISRKDRIGGQKYWNAAAMGFWMWTLIVFGVAIEERVVGESRPEFALKGSHILGFTLFAVNGYLMERGYNKSILTLRNWLANVPKNSSAGNRVHSLLLKLQRFVYVFRATVLYLAVYIFVHLFMKQSAVSDAILTAVYFLLFLGHLTTGLHYELKFVWLQLSRRGSSLRNSEFGSKRSS